MTDEDASLNPLGSVFFASKRAALQLGPSDASYHRNTPLPREPVKLDSFSVQI